MPKIGQIVKIEDNIIKPVGYLDVPANKFINWYKNNDSVEIINENYLILILLRNTLRNIKRTR
ncbi:MAG: hypothetical protein ACE5K4_12410 [Candidatus Hydrothermarchaeota archaeon]